MEIIALIPLWQKSLIVSRRSERTRSQYNYHAGNLAAWLQANNYPLNTATITWPLLEDYLSQYSNGRAQNTVRQAVNALRSLFDYARARDEITHTEYEKLKRILKPPPPQYNAQRTLAINEIEQLISSRDNSPKGIRDAALMSLLFDSGLRSAEICCLRANKIQYNVEISPGVLVNRITTIGKGGAIEPAYFGQETRNMLDKWLSVRQADSEHIFVGIGGRNKGQRMTPGGLRKTLRDIGNEAGISGVSPHAFRRAFAVALESAGASTRTIKELGRWKTLQMVLLYTRDYQAAVTYNSLAPMDRLRQSRK
jgi:site-specific recombinase XerD